MRLLPLSTGTRRDVPFPDLIELLNIGEAPLNIGEAAYQERFRHSTIKRAKRQGLRRNAAVALGDLGDPRAVPALARALHDDEPIVRGHAAWALGRIGGAEASVALHARLAVEPAVEVREEMSAALEVMTGRNLVNQE